MAALTPTSIYRENAGSLTILFVNISTLTISGTDTWTLNSGAPVIAWNCQSINGTQNTDPDIQYTQSTGVFTFTNGSTGVGAQQMQVWMRT